ncbi:MAG: Adaptor for signal transduction [Stictis urceolatum]|nr:Adaptor for signal transduction [Stictis urceolata]
MAFPPPYHGDSDADDEFERSVMTSPGGVTDDDASVSGSDAHSTENTPTTFGHIDGDASSPRTIISEWTADECAGFVKSLGLQQYCANFLENEIAGDALIALRHDELKEMGVASVGHRLTILKGVYDVKIKQDIPIEADHYVPLCKSQNNKKATQEDISRIIHSIKLRDERILLYEEQIKRIQEDYRKLREELLPVFRMAKERSQPLPSPNAPQSPDVHNSQHDGVSSPVSTAPPPQSASGTGLMRKGSKKAFWINSTPKNASPTYIQQTIPEGKTPRDSALDPSAAAIAASSHLTASMTSSDRSSPNPATLPSPTSPQHYHNNINNNSTRYNPRDNTPSYAPSSRTEYSYNDSLPQFGYSGSSSSTLVPDSASQYRNNAPTPTPGRSRGGSAREPDNDTGKEAPSVEIFKSFRVSMEDPCYKVLPAALKKYAINADWRQYALYIVYGDQERCLGLEEKPLILFKQLDKDGRKPMFMLRRHAAPIEGHSGPSGGGGYPGSGGSVGSGGQSIPIPQLPGGVL